MLTRDTKNSHRVGFTLVEILVVMAIIGILAGVVGGSFLSSRLRARDAERKSSLAQLQRAFEVYYNDYGQYPDPAEVVWGAEFSDANGTVYMAAVPDDPNSPTRQYEYELDSTGQKYRLYASLENLEDRDAETEYIGVSCGAEVCNYGVSSPSTTMTETW